MRVLVACEESQAVCKAFRERGHEAYSCDIQECSGGHPEWHIVADVLTVLNDGWDMMIAHPPCTYLSRVSIQHMDKPGRAELREQAIEFFMLLKNARIPKKCIENPVPQKYVRRLIGNPEFKKPEPIGYGDPHMKGTCLWLNGIPLLP